MHAGDGIRLSTRGYLVGPPNVDHGSFPKAGLCVTDSTSAPMRLVLGPMLVHRQHSLSAFAIRCVEIEPPGHHEDRTGVKSVDAGIRRRSRTHRVVERQTGTSLGGARSSSGPEWRPISDRIAGCAVRSRTRPCCPSAWSRALVRNHRSPRWWWHARSRGLSRLPRVPGTGPSHHRACQLLSGQSSGCGSWVSSKPDWMRRTPPARPCVWSSVRACPAANHPIRKCNPMRGYVAIRSV